MATRKPISPKQGHTINITYATAQHLEAAQTVFNHKEVIGWLGGFTMLDTLKASAVTPKSGKVGMWVAREETGQVVGALLCAGRPAAFRAKYGSVGVLPEWRRKRISTALYACMTLQGVMEGRRLWEDSIVGDNPFQFAALPTFGLRKVGELRHRTGSGKGLVLFDFSLLEPGAIDAMISRAFGGPCVINMELLSNYYSDECLAANLSAYAKQMPEFIQPLQSLQQAIKEHSNITIKRDDAHPTDTRRTANAKTKPLFSE